MGRSLVDARRLEQTLLDCLSYASPQAEMDRVRGFIVDLVRPRLRDDLFDQVIIDEQGNLLARRFGPPGTKPLLIFGYAATHPAEGMADAYPARVLGEGADRRLRGRGAAEQRSALAAALEGVASFLASGQPLRRGLDLVVCVAGEMGNHLVAAELVERHGLEPGAAVVAAASDNQLCLGNLGRVDIHVTINGRSAHSSDPSAGISALEGARRFLNCLAELRLERVDPELGRATLAPTFLETLPRASHTIPRQAVLILDRRLLPGEEIPSVLAEIEGCARDLGGCRAEIVAGHFNYPNKISPEAEVVQAARQAMIEVGVPDRTVYKRSALDAGFFTRRGADCLVFGPGDPRLGHSDEEWVSLAQVVQAAQVYERLCARLCSEVGQA